MLLPGWAICVCACVCVRMWIVCLSLERLSCDVRHGEMDGACCAYKTHNPLTHKHTRLSAPHTGLKNISHKKPYRWFMHKRVFVCISSACIRMCVSPGEWLKESVEASDSEWRDAARLALRVTGPSLTGGCNTKHTNIWTHWKNVQSMPKADRKSGPKN